MSKLDRRPDLGYSHAFDDGLIRGVLTETPPVVPVLRAGDGVLFDEMTLHRTDRRQFDDPDREKALTWFFAPSRFSPAVNTPAAL